MLTPPPPEDDSDKKEKKVYNYCALYVQRMVEKEFVSICKEFSMNIVNGCIASVF